MVTGIVLVKNNRTEWQIKHQTEEKNIGSVTNLIVP
jgi:hypothetical protein